MAHSETEGENKQRTDGCSADPKRRPLRPGFLPPPEALPASALLYSCPHARMEVQRNVGMLDESVESFDEFRITRGFVLV
jgi:hypothetical protein